MNKSEYFGEMRLMQSMLLQLITDATYVPNNKDIKKEEGYKVKEANGEKPKRLQNKLYWKRDALKWLSSKDELIELCCYHSNIDIDQVIEFIELKNKEKKAYV
jgi:hypothetical protein